MVLISKVVHESRFHIAIGFFVCLGLQGCTTRSVTLIHPGTGATVRCEETGTGIVAANVGVMLENCVKEHILGASSKKLLSTTTAPYDFAMPRRICRATSS